MKNRGKIIGIIFILILIYIIFFLKLTSATQTYLNESPQWQQNLTAVQFSSIATGDIDNDNDLDLAIIGCLTDGSDHCENGVIAKIYINDGTSLVESEQWESNLTGVGIGSLALGDVDNDGDLDLSLIGCTNSSGVFSTNCQGEMINKMYINNGTTFTENSQWQSNLTGVTDASSELGDVDNDGDLDLVMNGATATSRVSKIYINNGTSFVESYQWQNNLTGITEGEISLGDVDNDGDLDLVIVGDDGTGNFINLYINNGTTFTENSVWRENLLSRFFASSLFGDYNNDGNLDLIICGQVGGDHCDLYQNNGSTLIVNQTEDDTLGAFFRASIGFGDYENDGDLDLAIIGNEVGRSTILENNESNNYQFTRDIFAPDIISDGLLYGSLVWGDLEEDGDLDLIIIAGDANLGVLVARVYLSNVSLTKSNTQPSPPNDSFSSSYVDNMLTLNWGNGSDDETNISGLYYNLMVGNETDNNTIVSGVYGGSSGGAEGGGGGASGYFGNMMQRKAIALTLELEANTTYNWYVQTIDTGLAKSNWSEMQTFTTALDVTKPEITIEEPSPNASLHTSDAYFIFNTTVGDATLANVSLYADWDGSFAVNETNTSGTNDSYTFERNLTGYSDNEYTWEIEACDSESNCQTSLRGFYLDREAPLVSSISPVDSWTDSNTVTFSFNVTDLDIANCSLIIDNAIDQTNSSISENITQTFTKELANGDYTWYVNCTDYVGFENSSASRSLSINYTASASPSSGGGGGGTTSKTYTLSETQLNEGYTQELAKSDKIKFTLNNESHILTVNVVYAEYANLTLSSEAINFLLYINETKSFDVTNDNYYDLSVKLNSIENNKANLTIIKLSEKLPVEEENKGEENETGKETETGGETETKKLNENKGIWIFIGIIIVITGVILTIILNKYIKHREWKKNTLLG